MPVQACRIAVGVHYQVSGVDHAVFVLHARVTGTIHCVDRRVAALRHQTKTPFDLGRRGGRHYHVGDAPLRIDHGEPALGEDEYDRRGKSGGVDQAAQRFRRGQVVSRVKEKNGAFRHFHQARRIHRQHAYAVGKQRQRRKHGSWVASERHKRQIRHVSSLCLLYWFCIVAAIVLLLCVIGVSLILSELCGHLRLHLMVLHT